MLPATVALFGAEFANVQPHSGAQANSAVLHALMSPGERLLGLTWPTVVTRRRQRLELPRLRMLLRRRPGDTLIDMDAVRATALKFRPKVIIAGYLPAGARLRRSGRSPTRSGPSCQDGASAGLVAAAPVAGAARGCGVHRTAYKTLGGGRPAGSSVSSSTPRRSTRRCFLQQGVRFMHVIAGQGGR